MRGEGQGKVDPCGEAWASIQFIHPSSCCLPLLSPCRLSPCSFHLFEQAERRLIPSLSFTGTAPVTTTWVPEDWHYLTRVCRFPLKSRLANVANLNPLCPCVDFAPLFYLDTKHEQQQQLPLPLPGYPSHSTH